MEIEWSATTVTFPLAWPALGEGTNNTKEYFSMVLDAHASRKIKRK